MSVLVGVGTSVLNTRNLSVAEYGDVRYINNFMNFFASIFLFGFFVSGARLLAISKYREERKQINGAMILVLAIASLATILCMIICYFAHNLWFDANTAPLFLISLPISIAPLFLNYVNNTFQGENRIISLSIARCLPSILYLVIAYFVYQQVKATSTLMILLQNGLILIVLAINIICTKPSFKNMRATFRTLINENKRYGIHVYWGSVFAVSFGYFAGIFLGIFSENNADVGFFTLASTIAAPLAILPAITGTSYFREFANQTKISNKLLWATLAISLVSFVAFDLVIYPVVRFLYEPSYVSVASIAIYLAVGTIIHGFGDMFNRFLGAHGYGKALRNGALSCGLVLMIGNVFFVYLWGIDGAIITRILSSSFYLLSMVWYYRKFRIKVSMSK